MQFIYDEKSGNESLEIQGELYKYLIKVRRHNVSETLNFRNLLDENLYCYKIESISKKDMFLSLVAKEIKIVQNAQNIHLAWCIVDPRTIEKELPSLNELGVAKISFIYADYSQKNFKLNFEKLQKILINSSQQCGRSNLMQFEEFSSIDEFLKIYPKSFVFNFSKTSIDEKIKNIETIIVGCEGGFSKRELELFEPSKIVGANSSLILKSQTAMTFVASKLLICNKI